MRLTACHGATVPHSAAHLRHTARGELAVVHIVSRAACSQVLYDAIHPSKLGSMLVADMLTQHFADVERHVTLMTPGPEALRAWAWPSRPLHPDAWEYKPHRRERHVLRSSWVHSAPGGMHWN